MVKRYNAVISIVKRRVRKILRRAKLTVGISGKNGANSAGASSRHAGIGRQKSKAARLGRLLKEQLSPEGLLLSLRRRWSRRTRPGSFGSLRLGRFLLLGGGKNGMQNGAFHARHELHNAGFANVLNQPVDDGVAQLAVSHLAAAE